MNPWYGSDPPLVPNPHWDPVTAQYLQGQVVRRASAQGFQLLGIVALVFCWAPLVGLALPIGTLAGVRMGRREADRYAAYFPNGFPDYHLFRSARVMGVVSLCIAIAFQLLYVSWAIWLNTE